MLNQAFALAAAGDVSSTSITDALSTVVKLAGDAMSIITGNNVLLILFCASLMSVGFGVIVAAKNAARG